MLKLKPISLASRCSDFGCQKEVKRCHEIKESKKCNKFSVLIENNH